MPRPLLRHGAAVACVLVGGCGFPPGPFPGVAGRPPNLGRQVFEYHDPLPDEAAGPDVSRPREFDTQRTAPRRSADQRALQGRPVHTVPDPFPEARETYPGVVRE